MLTATVYAAAGQPLSPRRLPGELALARAIFLQVSAEVHPLPAAVLLRVLLKQQYVSFCSFFFFLSQIELLWEMLKSHTSPGHSQQKRENLQQGVGNGSVAEQVQ